MGEPREADSRALCSLSWLRGPPPPHPLTCYSLNKWYHLHRNVNRNATLDSTRKTKSLHFDMNEAHARLTDGRSAVYPYRVHPPRVRCTLSMLLMMTIFRSSEQDDDDHTSNKNTHRVASWVHWEIKDASQLEDGFLRVHMNTFLGPFWFFRIWRWKTQERELGMAESSRRIAELGKYSLWQLFKPSDWNCTY